jgi:hypothetical protein
MGLLISLSVFSINFKIFLWQSESTIEAWDLPRCLWSRSLLLKIEMQFPLNNLSLLWPIDTKLGVWKAAWDCYPGVSGGLLPRCQWSRSLLLKIEIQFLLNNLSLLWPIDTKLDVWVGSLGLLPRCLVIKVNVFSFQVITWVCFDLLTPNLLRGSFWLPLGYLGARPRSFP